MKRALIIFVFAALFGHGTPAHTAPVALLNESGVQIMLYTDACGIKAPKNLMYRATWTKGTEKMEGCFRVFFDIVVGLYFNDDTVVAVPVFLFKPVQEL